MINSKFSSRKITLAILLAMSLQTVSVITFASEDVKNLVSDDFNRRITRITAETETEVINKNTYYKGLGGNMYSGVYHLPSNNNILAGKDYVETVHTLGTAPDDYSLKVHTDSAIDPFASIKENIELVKYPNLTLDSEYDFVIEYDVKFENFNAGFRNAVKLKVDDTTFKFPSSFWMNTSTKSFICGNDKTPVEAQRWYHIAFVYPKDGKTFNVYVDGTLLRSEEIIGRLQLATFTTKFEKGTEEGDIYFDNVKYYETLSYDPNGSDLSVCQTKFYNDDPTTSQVDAINQIDGDTVVSITKLPKNFGKTTVVMCVYNNMTLENIISKEITVGEEPDEVKLTASGLDAMDQCTVRILVWNDYLTMEPLVNVSEIKK